MGLVETLATETLDTGAKVLESPGGTQRSKYFSSVSSVERSRSWKLQRDSDSSPVKRLTPLQVPSPGYGSASGGSVFESSGRTVRYNPSPDFWASDTGEGLPKFAANEVVTPANEVLHDATLANPNMPRRRDGNTEVEDVERYGRLRHIFHRRLMSRCFSRWNLYTREELAHDLHLEVRRQFVFMAQFRRLMKRRAFTAWRLWNGNPAQFKGTMALFVNRNKRFMDLAFRSWRRHAEWAKENDRMAIRYWRHRIMRRVVLWWVHEMHESNARDEFLKIKFYMFKQQWLRSIKLWVMTNWKTAVCWQDLSRWDDVVSACTISTLRGCFTAWRDWAKERKEVREKILAAWRYHAHIKTGTHFQQWRDNARLFASLRRLMMASKHFAAFLSRSAFSAWLSYMDAMHHRSRLIRLSAIKARLHCYFHAWRGYLEGYNESLYVSPARWGIEEALRVKQQLRDIGTLLTASTARRSRALIVNFQAARLWELLVAAFRGWAHESVDGFRPSEDPKPQSLGWYPIIRLIRVLHIEWALRVGEASWYKGLHDAQLVWHAWQVWRRFVGEQRLEMERRMLIAKRWHESRLAWRAFHAWVRFQIAYKIIHVLNEEARLLMFVTFQHWRRLACVSLSKRRRAARMAMKKYALIQQAFFNTWRRTAERARVGRHMKGLVAEVENAAHSAQADNDRLHNKYREMLEAKAASEEEAAQERDIAKRLAAEQQHTAGLYKDLMERAVDEAEELQKRSVAAEAAAATEKERAIRLASIVEAEKGYHDALAAKLEQARNEAKARRAALAEEIAKDATPPKTFCHLRSSSPTTPPREDHRPSTLFPAPVAAPNNATQWRDTPHPTHPTNPSSPPRPSSFFSPLSLSPPYLPRGQPDALSPRPSSPLEINSNPHTLSTPSPPFFALSEALPPQQRLCDLSPAPSPFGEVSPRRADAAAQLQPPIKSEVETMSKYTIDLWETSSAKPACTSCTYNTVCLCGKTASVVKSRLTG